MISSSSAGVARDWDGKASCWGKLPSPFFPPSRSTPVGAPLGESSLLLPGAASLAPHWYVIPWSVFVIVATTNAVNLTDGLDGLAAGCALLAFAAIGVIAAACATGEARELTVVAAAAVGAAAGFLRYNRHPARVFMGNTGALALGGTLGFISLATGTELLLPLVAGVFVAEAASVILQVGSYRLRGKRILLCAPLHHHFEFLGWPEPMIVSPPVAGRRRLRRVGRQFRAGGQGLSGVRGGCHRAAGRRDARGVAAPLGSTQSV